MSAIPTAVRSKIASFDDAAEAARVLAANTLARIGQLQKSLLMEPADSSDLEVEIIRLQNLNAKQNGEARSAIDLAAKLRRFLQVNSNLAEAPTPKIDKADLAFLPQAVERTRDDISTVQRQLVEVGRAGSTVEETKAAARVWAESLLRPHITFERGEFKLQQQRLGAIGPTPVTDVLGLLAWFDREKFLAAIDDLIEIKPEDGSALTAKERANLVAANTADLDRLERYEESLIQTAQEQGQVIERRTNASPGAILGVTITRARPKLQAVA